jgi:hypothetical protein
MTQWERLLRDAHEIAIRTPAERERTRWPTAVAYFRLMGFAQEAEGRGSKVRKNFVRVLEDENPGGCRYCKRKPA